MRKVPIVLVSVLLLLAVCGSVVYLRPEILPPGPLHPRYIVHEIKGDRIHPFIATDPHKMYSITLWDVRWPIFRKELYNYDEFVEYMVQGFTAINPNVRVEIRLFDLATTGDELRSAIEAGERPDVLAGTFDPALAERGLLVDLSPFFDEAETGNFVPAALKPLTVGGRIYAYPRWFEPQYMLGNATVLAKAGIDLDAIRRNGWTWLDVAGLGARFKGTEVIPLLIDTSDPQTFETLALSAGGGRAFDVQGNLVWSEHDLAPLVSVVDTLVKQRMLPSPPSRYRASQAELFWRGKVALAGPVSSGFLRYLRERAGGAVRVPSGEGNTPGFDIAVLPLPSEQGGQSRLLGSLSSLMIFDRDDRERARIATDFARFMATWCPTKVTDSLQLVSCRTGCLDLSLAGLILKTGTEWISEGLMRGIIVQAGPATGLDMRQLEGLPRLAGAVKSFWDRPSSPDKLVQSLHKAMTTEPPKTKSKSP